MGKRTHIGKATLTVTHNNRAKTLVGDIYVNAREKQVETAAAAIANMIDTGIKAEYYARSELNAYEEAREKLNTNSPDYPIAT